MSATDIVARLIAAWEALDTAAIAGCFTEDAVWHNMPFAAIEGRSNIEAAIARFVDGIDQAEFRIHYQAEARPGVVMNERNDILRMKDGKVIDVPVMGVFEIEGDRIRAWRDYFDAGAMNA